MEGNRSESENKNKGKYNKINESGGGGRSGEKMKVEVKVGWGRFEWEPNESFPPEQCSLQFSPVQLRAALSLE